MRKERFALVSDFFSAMRIALTAIVIPRKPPVPSGATLRAPCTEASFLRDSILSARRLSGTLKNKPEADLMNN